VRHNASLIGPSPNVQHRHRNSLDSRAYPRPHLRHIVMRN